MKILIVNSYYYPEIEGGAEISVKKLAEGLAKKGNEVSVLCTYSSDIEEETEGVKIYRFKPKNVGRAKEASGFSAYKKIRRRIQDIYNPHNRQIISNIVNKVQPDVIHTNGLYDITPVIWDVAKKAKIPVVHTFRDYFLACPRVNLRCKKCNGECVNPDGFCKIHRNSNIKRIKSVSYFTAPSAFILNKMCFLMKLGTFENKAVVQNALDYDVESVNKTVTEKAGRRNKGLVFFFSGTFSEEKGVKVLLDAFEQMQDTGAYLWFAGKGPLEGLINERAEKNRAIINLGFLTEEELGKKISEADILCCPSLWDEPFGRVVLDAYKYGMPVICSDKGALTDIVKDGKTGTVVYDIDAKKLESAMRQYFDDDIRVSRITGTEKEIVKYRLDTQIDRFIQIYEKVCR